MEIEPTISTPVTPGPSAEEKMDVDEDKEKELEAENKEGEAEKKEGEGDKKKRVEKVGYEVSNLSRVLPAQLKYISFLEDGRYEPVKKVCFMFLHGVCGC
jgi:26S proteasome regulatory subunit N2